MKVFLTGGAGYVGSLLVGRLLARGDDVYVFDNLSYGVASLFTRFIDRRFALEKGDIRDRDALARAVQLFAPDIVIHLAAIVGYPACARDPRTAMDVNIGGTEALAYAARGTPIVFASTGSAYGKVEGVCTEESPCEPLSLYGQTKRAAELTLLERGGTVILRFATAFGLSHRLRLDLLPNDFAFQAVHNKQLIVYEAHYRRTFIHVHDMVRALIFACDSFDKLQGGVFNVGDELMNLTKRELAEAVGRKVDYYLHFADVGTDADQRDYEVSYEKIRGAGFHIEVDMDAGLEELVRAFQAMVLTPEQSFVLRSTLSNLAPA